MPTKAHRPTLARTHSRSSSGGSSKVVLNLQLTQKEPVLPKIDKARRTSHPFEPAGRTNVLRTGSTVRVQSREHVPSAAPRRAATNPPPSRGGKPKAGFTIAASTVASDDEDEWVSSESGAATPLNDASGDEGGSGRKTPQELQSPTTPVDPAGNGQNAAFVPSTTPRAEPTQPRPRVQTNGFTVRPPPVAAPAARIPSPSQHPQQEQEPHHHQQPKYPSTQPPGTPQDVTQPSPLQQARRPPPHILDQQPHTRSPTSSPPRTPEAVPRVSGARTEPPTPTSPRSDRHSSGKARPASTRSLIADHNHALRPHPLIRGQSFGHGHLAPLKVTPDAAQVQLSSSPPYHAASSSPTSIRTVHTPPQATTGSPGTHFSSAIFRRRPSTSSARSVSTLPVLQQPLTPVERARTTSTLSTASSSTVLSSLAHFPHTRGSSAASAAAAAAAAAAATAVSTAQTPPLVVHFPSHNSHHHAQPETVHTLLPPPYVTPHFTILQWRSPIRESHARVVRARDATQRGGRRGGV